MQPLQVGTDDVPMSGGIPYAVGQASMIRIPIPGQRGLCIELSARNFKGTSTSTIFFQDVIGKKNLRLDYGYNKVSKVVDYHWNQKSVFTNFGIADHTTVGQAGRLAYGVAKYFRYAGRLFVVAGVALDVVSVVRSSRPLRRASQAVAGWLGPGQAARSSARAARGSGPALARSALPRVASVAASLVVRRDTLSHPKPQASSMIGPRTPCSCH
jgi:hypothetical protein